jgi:hypothetical protein
MEDMFLYQMQDWQSSARSHGVATGFSLATSYNTLLKPAGFKK